MKHEIKKMLLRKELWIVLLLLFLGAIFTTFKGVDYVKPEMIMYYREITAKYANTSLFEVKRMLEIDLNDLNNETVNSPRYYERCVVEELYHSFEQYTKRDENRKKILQEIVSYLDSSEYQQRDAEYAYKLYNRPIQDAICNRIGINTVLKETAGKGFSFDNTFILNGIYLLLICILIAPLFSIEYESGMYQLLYISKRGRTGLYIRKITSGLIAVTVLSVLYTIALYTMQWHRYGLSIQMLQAPIQCTDQLALCPYILNIYEFIFMHMGMYCICGWFLLGMSVLCSTFEKKALTVFISVISFTAFMIIPPNLMGNNPNLTHFAKQIGIFRLLYLNGYLEQYETVNVLGIPIAQLSLSIWATLLLTICLLFISFSIELSKGR